MSQREDPPPAANAGLSISERKAEQFILATLLAISEGNKDAAVGGLMFLSNHIRDGGDLPQTVVKNLLERAQV